MIAVISTCSEKLSEEEFVKPVINLINEKFIIIPYLKKADFSNFKKIIICGTALKDNEYLKHIESYNFIKNSNMPILGICSGMQLISLQFGSKIIKNKEIGLIAIKTVKENRLFIGNFEGYNIHQNSVAIPKGFDILAESKNSIQALKHKEKEIYGLMFHPEVRNQEIIRNFLSF